MRAGSPSQLATRLKLAAAEAAIETGRHALTQGIADRHLRGGGRNHKQEEEQRAHLHILAGCGLRNAKGPANSRGAFAKPAPRR